MDICLQKVFDRIDAFDCGPPELGNKPPTKNITGEKLKDLSLNLYACEWLFLCRYLAQIVCDLIPEDSAAWRSYLLPYEIVQILKCPIIRRGTDVY